ncbi:MAG: type II toxin-antitoxin system HicB family antitoxin [Gemmatimonadetes bacterium]|nr:type II toxin-antitoxin system HicB family antitoxin [Gemmatimonadota bacterium]
MRRYLVIVEPTGTGYSAYAPDLRGCVTTGRTRHEAETNIREAVEFHLAGLLHEGQRVPEPRTGYAHVHVGA